MLIYTGGGFIPDIPARDLTDEDIKATGLTEAQHIATGIYTSPTSVAGTKPDTKPVAAPAVATPAIGVSQTSP
jgi:hypothetical protein